MKLEITRFGVGDGSGRAYTIIQSQLVSAMPSSVNPGGTTCGPFTYSLDTGEPLDRLDDGKFEHLHKGTIFSRA
jgi:hypothetical protein